MATGSLRNAGGNGDYWGVSAYPSELYAYVLDFSSATVVPSDYGTRWDGFTVQPTTTKFQVSVSGLTKNYSVMKSKAKL